MIGAHPDDCEFKAGATAALWADAGAKVLFMCLTNGDAGHHEMSGGALARRRAEESKRSTALLGVQSLILDNHDGELEPSIPVRKAVIKAIREWQAEVVITHRPNDYHPDHRYTSQVVQDAAYTAAVPNYVPHVPALRHNPVFMYFQDGFRKPCPFRTDVAVDAARVLERKLRALDTMDSQMYEWLPWIEGQQASLPSDPARRLEWLRWFAFEHLMPMDPAVLEPALEARYGKGNYGDPRFAEAFELCEYGRQPSRAELWQLFPK